jgi:hypothetical protein
MTPAIKKMEAAVEGTLSKMTEEKTALTETQTRSLPPDDPRRKNLEASTIATQKPDKLPRANVKPVADPKSPTGWSYQNMDALEEPLIPGAPPPHLPTEGLTPNQMVSAAHNLRTEIRQNPYVKGFSDIRTKYDIMSEALKSSATAKNKIAIDQAIITLFNKMTDPQSVVRESEYARTPKDEPLINRVKGQAMKILEGGAGLTDEDRNALVAMGNKFYKAYEKNYNEVISDYEDLAKRSKLDPDLVVGTYRFNNKGKTGKSEKSVVRTGTYNGKKVIEYSDGSVEYAQ